MSDTQANLPSQDGPAKPLRSKRWLAVGVATLAVIAVVVLYISGPWRASAGVVCPAIGWSDTLTVQVTGPRASEVAGVRACRSNTCDQDQYTSTAEPDLLGEPGDTANTWVVQFPMLTPTTQRLVLTTSQGTVLSDTDVPVSWQQVGGTEECGGPHAATVSVSA